MQTSPIHFDFEREWESKVGRKGGGPDDQPLRAPFPYFGGKARAAPEVWRRFGDVKNYVEPFFGGGAVLLDRKSVV